MSNEVLPAPVGPQTARISPGSTSSSTPLRTSLPVRYENRTLSNRTGSGPAGSAPGCAGSGKRATCSSHAKLRPADARARCARFVIQPSASSGQTSCSSSVSKRTNSPIERFPAITCLPPKNTTAAIERDGR